VTETLQWIDPDGVSVTLDVDQDTANRFMPRVEVEEDGVPGQPGLRLRDVRHGVTEFPLPFWVHGSSESDLRVQLRAMIRAMNPGRGVGKLRITSPVGDQREINCIVVDGLGLKEAGGETGPTDQRIVAVFRAHDPYYYDVSATTQPFEITDTPSFFPWGGSTLFRLTSSEIFSDGSVENDGDVETWPVWTITGPGSVITLENLTTGKTLTFATASLTTGETIVIDTRPGAKTVLKNGTTNLFPDIGTSSLWPLAAGTNLVRLQMAGADAVTSSVVLSYTQRYLSP
jgi:hypothetical protein